LSSEELSVGSSEVVPKKQRKVPSQVDKDSTNSVSSETDI